MDVHLEKRILACPSLPTLPGVALELVRLCRSDAVEPERILACLGRDPALAAKLLRVASSVAPEQGGVASLPAAAAVLGPSAVLALALGFTLGRSRRREDARGLDPRALWRRAGCAAVAGRALAGECGADPEEAAAAGLLQDVGALAMAEALRREYAGVLAAAADAPHSGLAALERSRLGTDHAEVSALLALRWGLPAALAEALRRSHEAPDPAAPPLVRCATLARAVAAAFAAGASLDDARAALEEARGALPLGALARALARVREELPALEEALAAEVDPLEAERAVELARETLVLLSFRTSQTAREAERAMRALASEKRALERRSRTDALTGVSNRGHAEEFLLAAARSAAEEGRPLALVLCDVDHFKLVNDGYGHPTGDRLLQEVARALAGAVRDTDLVGRWGGDELVAVLPDADLAGACVVAERVRARVAELAVAGPAGEPVRASLSIGLAASFAGGAPARELLDAADAALYDAKRGGRNRICARELGGAGQIRAA